MENITEKINEFVEEQIADVKKYGHTKFSTAHGSTWDKDIYAYREVIAKKLREKGFNVGCEYNHQVYDYFIVMNDLPENPVEEKESDQESIPSTIIVALSVDEEEAKTTAYLMNGVTYESWDDLNKFLNDHFVQGFDYGHVIKLSLDDFISALNNNDLFIDNWFFAKVFVYDDRESN